MSAKKLVVGNWKMNPATSDEAKRLARKAKGVAADLSHVEAILCPPFPFIQATSSRKNVPNYHIGAQTASFEESTAHTGEVSAAMLRDMGVEYVIVGHSETRRKVSTEGLAASSGASPSASPSANPAGDTNEMVSKRIGAVLEAGMTPIVCVGEEARDENGAYFDILKEQIKQSLANVPQREGRHIILAYEPVWAIGAKEAMNPEQVYEMSIFVKKVFADIFGNDCAMKASVLYGGSVNFRNAADIIKIGKVDGLLVGRESINIAGFVELLKTVDAAGTE